MPDDVTPLTTEAITYTLVGTTWVYSDGTVLPAARGGDGTEGSDATGAPGGDPAPVAAAGETPPVNEPSPVATDDISGLPASWQSHVRELRAESAARRTALAPFSSAFEGYDDADRDTLLALATTLRSDPRAAGEWMRQQAEVLLADQAADVGPGARDPDRPMTRSELEAYMAERDQRARAHQDEAAQVAAIVAEAKTLGYDPESDRRGYARLLDVAMHETGGDLQAAHDALKADRQKVIDEYLGTKAATGDAGGTLPPQSGSAQEAPGELGDWREVGAAVRARLAQL